MSTLEHANEHLHVVTVRGPEIDKSEMLKGIAAVVKILECGFAVFCRAENSFADKRNFQQKTLKRILKVKVALLIANSGEIF